MANNSIANVLFCLILILVISGCSNKTIAPETRIDVKEVPISKPAPIVPSVDQINMRDVQWIILTPDNIEEIFNKIKQSGSEPVLFGLAASGYENLSLNLNDVRSMIQQQQTIIAIYKQSYVD